MKSLAEALHLDDPTPTSSIPVPTQTTVERLCAYTGKEFAQAVLDSLEFRRFIVQSLQLGELPAAVLIRLMDYGWGVPAKKIEHTGQDGAPIETVKIIRVIVDPRDEALPEAAAALSEHVH